MFYMDDKKKKKFIIPEAEIIEITNDDIITESGEWWITDDNQEAWPW